MSKPIASLSLGSYIKDLEMKVDLALAYAFSTEMHQSNTYMDSLTSLPDIFRRKNGNIDGTKTLLRDKLERYLSRLFDGCAVEVSQVESVDDPSSKVTLSIRIVVMEGEKSYNVERILKDVKGKYQLLTNINNYGDA